MSNTTSAAAEFTRVAEHLPEALALVALDGRVIAVNRSARSRYRALARAESRLSDQFEFHDRDVGEFLRGFARCRQPAPGRLLTRPGGDDERSTAHINGSLYSPSSQSRPALVTLHFSPRARWLEHFRKAQERVGELDYQKHQVRNMLTGKRERLAEVMHAQRLESLGLLAGGVAHDFNNILTSILGYADLARHHLPDGSPASTYVDSMISGVHNAAGLARQLLAYSGKGRFVEEKVDLRRLIRETHELVRVSISPDTKISYRLKDDVPCCKVDASQIQQVIMNLILNADEAMGGVPGVITVTVGQMHCDRRYIESVEIQSNIKEGEYVYFQVSDEGSGMSEEDRRRIFDPFFTTKAHGHGLGLAAVMGIVEGHSGAVNVYSEKGRGSTFKVLLPAVAGEEATQPEDVTIIKDLDAHILVVDDDPMIRKLTGELFKALGATVETAENGREGVDLFAEDPGRFDAVLLDMTMPVMDGKTALEKMRRIDSDVRVVMCSGYNEQVAISDFTGREVAGFIQKPYTMAAMRRAISRALISDADEEPER